MDFWRKKDIYIYILIDDRYVKVTEMDKEKIEKG